MFELISRALLALWDLWDGVRRRHRDTDDEPEKVKETRDALQTRIDSLNKVDEHIWTRPVGEKNQIVDMSKCNTRFIAVCNLKGGTGKTTLTANLGSSLALSGKKVLLIDMDFQATLSDFLLPTNKLKEYQDKEWTSKLLLEADVGPAKVWEYITRVDRVPNASVLIAGESLDFIEYKQQARFFLSLEKEVRFNARNALHTEQVWPVAKNLQRAGSVSDGDTRQKLSLTLPARFAYLAAFLQRAIFHAFDYVFLIALSKNSMIADIEDWLMGIKRSAGKASFSLTGSGVG